MELSTSAVLALTGLVLVVAILYSSVGHGGASGYLAVLSLFAIEPSVMASTALVLNVLVAGIAFISYQRAGHFSFGLVWPFLIASVPAAFWGATVPLKDRMYFLLLGLVLVCAALRMLLPLAAPKENESSKVLPLPAALGSGGAIGLLSGMVGVGGGIFLSPLMIVFRWAEPQRVAAASAFFIVVNSIAGLAGRSLHGTLQAGMLLPLLAAGLIGSVIGSHTGARRFSGVVLRRILGVVLLLAAAKMLMKSL